MKRLNWTGPSTAGKRESFHLFILFIFEINLNRIVSLFHVGSFAIGRNTFSPCVSVCMYGQAIHSVFSYFHEKLKSFLIFCIIQE